MQCEMKFNFVGMVKGQEQCTNEARFTVTNEEAEKLTNLCISCYNYCEIKQYYEEMKLEQKKDIKAFIRIYILINLLWVLVILLTYPR